MTRLIPTRYSDKTNSTFFEVGGLMVTLGYEVVERKRWLVLPGSLQAQLTAQLGDGRTRLGHEFPIPRTRQVGDEIATVERGLYDFIDELVRSAAQLRALEAAEKEVEAVEADHMFLEGLSEPDAEAPARSGGEAAARRFVSELATRTITATRHLTNITSLTREGLDAYQRDRSHALERVLHSTSLTSSLHMQELLYAVEGYLNLEIESTKDPKALRERAVEYLALVQKRRGEPGNELTPEQVQIIANEFVPAFRKMRKRYEVAARYPRDVVGHAFGSFFGGGFAGWLTLSVFGEAVIRGLMGTSVDLPGWYIGAAAAFIWPYIKAASGMLTRDRLYESKRRALLDRVGHRLELTLPSSRTQSGM